MKTVNAVESRIMVIYNNIPDNNYKLREFSKRAELMGNKTRRNNTLEGIEKEKIKLAILNKEYLELFEALNLFKNDLYYTNSLNNGISHLVLNGNALIVLKKDYSVATELMKYIKSRIEVTLNVQTVDNIQDLITICKLRNEPFNEKVRNCIEQNKTLITDYKERFNLKDNDFN